MPDSSLLLSDEEWLDLESMGRQRAYRKGQVIFRYGPFGQVEDSIDEVAELTIDEKAALWLFAFSLRDPAEQQLDARAHLASLQ